MVDKWIQEAHVKKGSFHRALGIPKDKKIPITLINAILKAPVGKTITNPTKTGKSKVRATAHLKKQANFAKNVRR